MKPSLKAGLRPLNRLRWWRKSQIISSTSATPRQRIRYVLWDPELDTFSYELASPDRVAGQLSPVLGESADTIREYLEELRSDTGLAATIRTASRWHPESKRRPPLGRHAITYACLRSRRPALAVEIGVRHGLGSLVILRALQRNRGENAPGELLSIDVDPFAGRLVGRHTPHLQFECGKGSDVLGSVLHGRKVGFLLSDSVPDPVETEREVTSALASADFPIVVMQNGAWNTVTADLATRTGSAFAAIQEQPAGHWAAGRLVHVARLDALT